MNYKYIHTLEPSTLIKILQENRQQSHVYAIIPVLNIHIGMHTQHLHEDIIG